MERLIGIPLETALNGMPGLKYLRSISLAGSNDIKCQFEYGTDYWAARQEVINRIGMVSNLPPGVTPGALALEPDRRDRPLRAGRATGTRSNQLKAVQDWVLNRALQDGAGRDRRDRLRRHGQAVPDPARHPVDEAVRRDACRWSPTRSRKSNANVGGDILPLGPQSHNVRAIGYLGEGVDSLDPADGRPCLRDRGREARGHPGRRRDHATTTCRSTSSRSPRW